MRLYPLRPDPLDLLQLLDRPVGPPLDNAPGDDRPDPRQGLQLGLGRGVDVDQPPGRLRLLGAVRPVRVAVDGSPADPGAEGASTRPGPRDSARWVTDW